MAPPPAGTGDREGVIRFHAEHRRQPLEPVLAATLASLTGWRRILRRLGLLGRDPERYGGYSFGNLSRRVDAPHTEGPHPPTGRPFLVSGTQTSHEPEAPLERWAVVERWDFAAERVESRGEVEPSSESLTHAALYDADPSITAVFHVHAPELWQRAGALGLPVTPASAECGTAEMAARVTELVDRRSGGAGLLGGAGVIVMGGHRDGILASGHDPEHAGLRLMAALARTG